MTEGRAGAVIVAAGQGRRLGGKDKAFLTLAGRPAIAWVLDAFQDAPGVDEIVLVLNQGSLERGRRLVAGGRWAKVKAVCPGGERRQDSVQAGLQHLGLCQWAIIHDGARPCITLELIAKGLATAQEWGAAICAVPVKDTIKRVEGDTIQSTPDRVGLWAAQTPQVFRLELVREAYREAEAEATDDASVVERHGHPVRVYLGSYDNIKLTTPEDVAAAEAILRGRPPVPPSGGTSGGKAG